MDFTTGGMTFVRSRLSFMAAERFMVGAEN
ncbi:hypothetical protein shim_28620 [Shimia sp. SK013]|nr:hypothetical protein shim_28620 [Shimia sp. SK013]